MSEFKIMTCVTATYKPQGSQSFRCSINFPHWDSPKGGKLKFEVICPKEYPQPNFAIDHDKTGRDTRWYSDVYDGKIIDVTSEEGGPGGHALYIGTTSDLPKGLDGSQTYAVIVWESEN